MTTDHHHAPGDYIAPTIDLNLAGLRRVALLSAIIGAVAFFGFGFANLSAYTAEETGGIRDFFLTYQVGFIFWLSIPVGAMTLLMLAYVTSASWGLVLRRIFQAATRTWPMMAILFCPVAASLFMTFEHDATTHCESPFWWVQDADQIEFAAKNIPVIEEIQHRQSLFLNIPRFLITAAVIFTIYGLMMRGLNKWAPKAEDEGDEESKMKLKTLSAPGILIWAITFTVAVTDWVMSVEPSWFSTMFPVVAGLNCFLTCFAFSVYLFYTLVGKNEVVLDIVKYKFRIDIGSLMLGFTMVWAYASFCQYMLIWAGNLPEEITYYKRRLNGGWEFAAYALMLIHWFLPFIILLFRQVKTSPSSMRLMTLMLLFICMVDVVWWIVPSYSHANGYFHVPMAIAALVGVGGIWGLAFTKQLGKANLFPKRDTEFLATWGAHH